ncbi:carbamoyltransferase HypF [Amycolatopsis sp. NPDC049868]|uniref:carbamoyltransferase HypF n=1 Tax=Amycolatopsis sp. NPDC049868 TaxID=3363934 RepID=UPI0037B4848D
MPGGDVTQRWEVHGAVQGVGFRPYVHRVATALGVGGEVRNIGGHVVITASAHPDVLARFHRTILDRTPPPAMVERIDVTTLKSPRKSRRFSVRDSVSRAGPRIVPVDLTTCAPCLEELFDPADRRYRYPFLNCSRCGPRATIVEQLPYDRVRTAMNRFPMCDRCAGEYHDPTDRRFHAEPIACPRCGPRLSWAGRTGEEALAAAVTTIGDGGVVAIKGIGGYQLVCDATNDQAVGRLRAVKHRRGKPFAVMVADLREAAGQAVVDGPAARRLESVARPIVLLPKRPGTAVSGAVAPRLPEIGLFLPNSPLHHLLLHDLGRPLVVTSGNLADEPITVSDEHARASLGPVTDGILGHDRPILTRNDDSVMRAGRLIRRARGYAPDPLALPVPSPRSVLALGAHLKNTVTLAVGDRAVISPHIGDLAKAGSVDAFERTTRRLCHWLDVTPEFCAHDLHPRYHSTSHAANWPSERRIAVQHHHAHVAAVAAEHGVDEPFIGVAYDGLGLGDDNTLWGGEVLLATYTGYRRLGRFGRVALPGGDVAVRRPDRMALGYRFGAEDFGADRLPQPPETRESALVRRMIERRVNSPLTSSAGRLFDAVAAMLGLCDENSYEGEAAILLEAAASGEPTGDPFTWNLHRRDGLWVYDPVPTLRELLGSGDSPVPRLAARFHATIAEVTVALVSEASATGGSRTVCLGGGVFQNDRLTTSVTDSLTGLGFRVLTGERVPVNDGGISFGQAAVAAALLTGRSTSCA